MGLFVKGAAGWTLPKKIFVNTGGTWVSIKKGFVKTISGWQSFWPKSGPTPTSDPYFSTDSAGNNIFTSAYRILGTSLYGQNGTWNNTGFTGVSYAYRVLAYPSASGGVPSGTPTTISSGTYSSRVLISLRTSSFDGVNSPLNGKYLDFEITDNNLQGIPSVDSVGNGFGVVYLVTNPPLNNTNSMGTANTSLYVGNTINYTSTWEGSEFYYPDYKRTTVQWYKSQTLLPAAIGNILAGATLISGTGFTTSTDGLTFTTTSSYTTTSSDAGYYFYVVEYEYNTGSDYFNSPQYVVTTSAKCLLSAPVNTVAPYWTDTSNNAFSGQIDSGTTLRLHFGTWSNSPTYYEYEIYYNDQAGTIINQDISGTYTQNYVDYTFYYNASHTGTIGAAVYAGNSGGLGNVASAATIGGVIPAAPGNFSITNFYDSSPTPSTVSVNTPYQGSGSTANTLYYTWTAPVIYNYLGNAYTVANFNSRYVGPTTSNSDTRTVTNDFWPNAITQSGYYYAYVAAVNSSVLQVTANWTASTNAAYYKVVYTINGTPYTSNALYTTSWSFLSSSTVTLNGVIAYNSDASRTTIVSYNQDITPTSKTGSEGFNYAYLTYTQPTWTITYLDSVDSASGSVTVNQGSSTTLPSPSGVTNYTFNGWYTASSGGTRVGGGGNSYTPSSDIYLYARWTYTPPTPNISQIISTPGRSSTPYMSFTITSQNTTGIVYTVYRGTTSPPTTAQSGGPTTTNPITTSSGGLNYYYYIVATPYNGSTPGTTRTSTIIRNTSTANPITNNY